MEQYDLLKRHFEHIGARLKLTRSPGRFWFGRRDGFEIDINSDRKGEYFHLVVYENPGTLEILDVRPRDRHLLLMARFDPSLLEAGDKRHGKFLCGHDERHWFVAAVDSRSRDVKDAKHRLKPQLVLRSEENHRVKRSESNRRRNKGFVRQGEWFFVPSAEVDPDAAVILRRELLRRGGGKPHVAEEAYRVGGETVYVNFRYPNGLSEKEFAELLEREPNAKALGWQVMVRNPDVYARGWVRHPDHATVILKGWHRVVSNKEVSYEIARMSPMAFLD